VIKHALFVRLEAKPGKEKEVAQFLQAGVGLAQQEGTTPVWFACGVRGESHESSKHQHQATEA